MFVHQRSVHAQNQKKCAIVLIQRNAHAQKKNASARSMSAVVKQLERSANAQRDSASVRFGWIESIGKVTENKTKPGSRLPGSAVSCLQYNFF